MNLENMTLARTAPPMLSFPPCSTLTKFRTCSRYPVFRSSLLLGLPKKLSRRIICPRMSCSILSWTLSTFFFTSVFFSLSMVFTGEGSSGMADVAAGAVCVVGAGCVAGAVCVAGADCVGGTGGVDGPSPAIDISTMPDEKIKGTTRTRAINHRKGPDFLGIRPSFRNKDQNMYKTLRLQNCPVWTSCSFRRYDTGPLKASCFLADVRSEYNLTCFLLFCSLHNTTTRHIDFHGNCVKV